MTAATDTKHLASVCWHITIDMATGEEVDRDMHEEWTLDMYHNTVHVYLGMLNLMGARHLVDTYKPVRPMELSELIHDNDIDIAWMMRKDLDIMGRNVVLQRDGQEHHIGIAYVA